ncbi:hypothetical protein CASFOL_000081 [Castilleja foliolosa]|uniref:Uncharacterized protein n=1 Tax=Castilleja foliolosa TaxID=1961234 RepID=A0ABD3EN85_9LAMI
MASNCTRQLKEMKRREKLKVDINYRRRSVAQSTECLAAKPKFRRQSYAPSQPPPIAIADRLEKQK